MDKGSIIAECSLLRGVSLAHRRRLVNMARRVTFATGTLVFRQDDPCPGIFCVGSGVVRVYRIGAGGKEHTLHMAVRRVPCYLRSQSSPCYVRSTPFVWNCWSG